MSELIVRHSIAIDAPAAKVWQVLTTPEFTRQYMFGCVAVTDWKQGSPLNWQGVYEGKETVFVQGSIVAIEPERLLSYTTFGPNMGLADVPSNYLTVTCRLTPRAGGVTLEATQGDFAGKERAQARYDETEQGWREVLPKIKALAEG